MSSNLEKQDLFFMQEALKEAEKALLLDEVPVGAVLVKQNQIISRAYNTKESSQDATCHAEMKVIKEASKILKNWRLLDCELYVTLVPCVMCWGAVVSSRISRLIYGTEEIDTSFSLKQSDLSYLSSQLSITKGVLQKECSEILRSFFQEKRKEKVKKILRRGG